jgi:hypothetical protein
MICAGRKVFDGKKTFARIMFEGAPQGERRGGFYVVTEGFLLPVGMVKQIAAPGGFILTPDCSIMDDTVLNEKNEECVMIQCNDPDNGTKTELLIPCRILYKVVNPPGEAYPSRFR